MQLIAEMEHKLPIRSEVPEIVDSHGRVVSLKKRRLYAWFVRGGAPTWARDLALATFEFRQIPERGVTKEQMVCWYDSEDDQLRNGWTDEERAEIEAKLEEAFSLGQMPSGVLRVSQPRPVAPWPAYDKLVAQGRRTVEMVAEKIAERVSEDGYDAGVVAEYERATLNRPEVLVALGALVPAVEPDEELIEA